MEWITVNGVIDGVDGWCGSVVVYTLFVELVSTAAAIEQETERFGIVFVQMPRHRPHSSILHQDASVSFPSTHLPSVVV